MKMTSMIFTVVRSTLTFSVFCSPACTFVLRVPHKEPTFILGYPSLNRHSSVAEHLPSLDNLTRRSCCSWLSRWGTHLAGHFFSWKSFLIILCTESLEIFYCSPISRTFFLFVCWQVGVDPGNVHWISHLGSCVITFQNHRYRVWQGLSAVPLDQFLVNTRKWFQSCTKVEFQLIVPPSFASSLNWRAFSCQTSDWKHILGFGSHTNPRQPYMCGIPSRPKYWSNQIGTPASYAKLLQKPPNWKQNRSTSWLDLLVLYPSCWKDATNGGASNALPTDIRQKSFFVLWSGEACLVTDSPHHPPNLLVK